MPSTTSRSVCATCRLVSGPVTEDGACARCGGQLLLVSSKWRAPRRTNDRAWRDVAAGKVLWDGRAVRQAAFRKAAAAQHGQVSWRATRRAMAVAREAVPAPAGHGPIRFRPNDLHPHDCSTCVRAREVYATTRARLAGQDT